MIIKNGTVYTEEGSFEKKDILIEEEFISNISQNNEVIDAEGLYVIPGLTDIHFHGCVGYDFCDGTEEAVKAMAAYEAANGVTSICPATMTLGDGELEKIFKNAASYDSKEGAVLVGINMEGPYLSEAKKGAQNGRFLHKPDAEHFRKMQYLSGGLIKLVSLAPEEPGAMDFIEEVNKEVIVSIAHTTANYDIASEAFQKGASHVTHLCNAMPPFSHREPGVVGAAFDAEHSHVELISDGIHINPSVIRATFQLFGDDRVILISDSMMATGLKDGEYALGGQPVTVRGTLATLKDGTIAGSATNLMECMKKAISFGIKPESAVKAAAVNPAKCIGIYDKFGSISIGKYANLVLMDKDFNVLKVILKGKEVL